MNAYTYGVGEDPWRPADGRLNCIGRAGREDRPLGGRLGGQDGGRAEKACFVERTLYPVYAPALDGIEAGAHEVLADDTTRWIKSQLSADLEARYAQLQK